MLQHNSGPVWNSDIKQAARYATIIDRYYDKFGQHPVPKNKQYWTMCGQCTSKKDGTFLKGCELDHMFNVGLIRMNQFHGVEINPDIARTNKAACPKANWYENDFLDQMNIAEIQGVFRPAIVNADFTNMPSLACGYFASVLNFLSLCKGEILLIGNMTLEYCRFPHRNQSIDSINKKLCELPQVKSAFDRADWKYESQCYRYTSNRKGSGTVMGSIVFWKNS